MRIERIHHPSRLARASESLLRIVPGERLLGRAAGGRYVPTRCLDRFCECQKRIALIGRSPPSASFRAFRAIASAATQSPSPAAARAGGAPVDLRRYVSELASRSACAA